MQAVQCVHLAVLTGQTGAVKNPAGLTVSLTQQLLRLLWLVDSPANAITSELEMPHAVHVHMQSWHMIESNQKGQILHSIQVFR